MSILSVHREGTVAIIRMDAGENRHNPAFVAALRSRQEMTCSPTLSVHSRPVSS